VVVVLLLPLLREIVLNLALGPSRHTVVLLGCRKEMGRGRST